MSVVKLLSRIVAPSDLDFENSATKNQTLHDHTYGITSDPLTQFACVLSALIHGMLLVLTHLRRFPTCIVASTILTEVPHVAFFDVS